jgi:DNA-binding NtrC family response regulator
VRDRDGKFAEVGRGTLVLDDIDALPIDLQSKLLRVVEEGVFEPVGSNRLLRMEARLIVASNRSLEQEMAAGRLRADLYYRLNVVGFHLAPLRERREVIPPLIEHFLERYAEKAGLFLCSIAPAALQALRAFSWPPSASNIARPPVRIRPWLARFPNCCPPPAGRVVRTA